MGNRLYNINLFRIWFTLTIIYGHIIQHWMMPQFGEMPFFQNLYRHTSYSFGYMCDAFFVISGFFMFFTFLKTPSFKKMMVAKISRLWPVLAFCLLCFWGLSKFGLVKYQRYGNIPALFFLNSALTPVPFNNGAVWYINAMFWGYVFYYCLDKVVSDDIKIYVFSLIAFFGYSILLNKIELYDQPQTIGGVLSFPMIRALAGMSCGYVIARNYNGRTEAQNDRKVSLPIVLLEILSFFLIMKVSILKQTRTGFPIIISLFIPLFIVFVFNKGFLSKITNKKIFDILGRYCFSIYMMQDIGFHLANKFLWKNPEYGVLKYPVSNISACIVFCIVLGVFTYHVIEVPMKSLILKKFSREA